MSGKKRVLWTIAAAAVAVAAGPVGVLLLLPVYLAVRQLVRPTTEPAATWANALLIPSVVGLAAGLAGGLAYWKVETCPLECLGTQILAAFTVPPILMAGCALALRVARTPRAWLAGPLGVIAAIILAVFLTRVTYSHVLMSVFAGLAGFLWAALVLGPLIPPVARLIVWGLLFTVIPVTFAMQQVPARDKSHVARLERISMPLLAPDVPGFFVSYATGDKDADILSIDLTPRSAGRFPSMADQIQITAMALPADFDPPTSCGPPNRWSAASLPCTPEGPDLWRREYLSNVQFLRAHGRWLYIVQGGSRVEEALVQQAATSLRPVTARDLVTGR